ncbi:phosphonate ABC transporter, periplasmic phosphonate-binding protein [Desulfitobacterium hafniense DCB-2]|uniref:Phosphonate ABC transporter, periplasmic phosphonate-binding protein n=1 Tax=Desulfitobacterium hafniense (strain DSM 10664 / DCB-2) TaxID=272564 RepID=B8G135_DESHD|nr:phosphonate ABC transporter, periplasmic phosphonate-binding protein [Desulfitobacterium hafniense DCB-2]
MRVTKRRYSSIIFIVFATLILTGCQVNSTLPYVSLKNVDYSQANPQPLENTGVLKVGVASVLSPRETLEEYDRFDEYLEKEIGRPVELVQRGSYQEINNLVKTQAVDVAFICSGAYVVGNKDDLDLLAVPVVNGKSTYQSYIIVNAQSQISRFEQLKGSVFGYTDPISFSGTIYPMYLVNQIQASSNNFFNRVVYTYSHDNSIKAVLDGVVNAAGVDSLVYEFALSKDPTLATKLKIINRSQEVGSPPVVVNKFIDPNLRTVLQEALLRMDSDPLGQEALKNLNYERFALPSHQDYGAIEVMIKAVPELN